MSLLDDLPRLELTPGERLLISRLRAGVTQRQLAEWLGVTIGMLSMWESDGYDNAPAPGVGDLLPREWCRILRKRHGFAVRDIAMFSYMPRRYVLRAETGVYDPTDLVSWWLSYREAQVVELLR